MSHFRFIVSPPQGKHTHVRVFVGKDKNFTHANAGTLVFETDEWTELRKLCFSQSAWIEVVDEENPR